MLEIERLGEPIGKQDQHAAAHGGVNLIEFERHGGGSVKPLVLPTLTLSELERNLMLFFTGTQREAPASQTKHARSCSSQLR
jgi:D-glycero-alpha-D-manno-heptose-7-phosphate kinase